MTYEAYVLAQSPQLYIPWTETSGSVFSDLSGNGHDATPNPTVVTAGGIDGAIRGERGAIWAGSFTDFANVTTIPSRGAFTWLLWFRSPLAGASFHRLAVYQASDFVGTHMAMSLVNNGAVLPYYWQFEGVGPGGDGAFTCQIDDAFLECWHQFALTWGGTELLVYKDGVALVPRTFSAPTPSIWNTPNTPDTMGVSRFSGTCDVNHLAMYGRALSADDIAADYAAAVPLNTCLTPDVIRLTHAPGAERVRLRVPAGRTVRLVHHD